VKRETFNIASSDKKNERTIAVQKGVKKREGMVIKIMATRMNANLF